MKEQEQQHQLSFGFVEAAASGGKVLKKLVAQHSLSLTWMTSRPALIICCFLSPVATVIFLFLSQLVFLRKSITSGQIKNERLVVVRTIGRHHVDPMQKS